MFLTLMVVGIIGLILMAVPGFNRHGHVATTHGIGHAGHGGLHIAHGQSTGHAVAGAHGHAAGTAHTGAQGGARSGEEAGAASGIGAARLIPSPRAIFSVLTLLGAFGYALQETAHLPALWAGLIAALPTLLIERYAVSPLWNLLFQFQGKPCSPLEEMVMSEAEAVTPFHNGRGIVQVVRDGRAVQFSACLPESQVAMPVRVGDKLVVEDIDAAKERLTVSIR